MPLIVVVGEKKRVGIMTYDTLGLGALDYLPCRYGTSKLTFRGPRRALEAPYVAFLGGTATFGKFIEQPFPLLVEHLTGVTSVNFGQVNAGLDVFSKDSTVLEAARGAQVTVIEAMGPVNMNNRFYSVHPRRNDRFLHASPDLKQLYYDVDFTQFSFTQHMLRHLYLCDAGRFAQIRHMLEKTWVRRMRRLLTQLSQEVVLVRIDASGAEVGWSMEAGPAPSLITDDMVDRLGPLLSAIVDVSSKKHSSGSEGKTFSILEEEAAKVVPHPHIHQEVARALYPVLDRLM